MTNTRYMPELADQKDRLQAMTEGAESIRTEEYWADLSPEELDFKNEQFAINATELNKIELKKKEAMDGFKLQMKPLEIVYGTLLEEITMKKEKRTGRLYDIIDTETSMMVTYDDNGDMIASRRLTPEEKKGQSRLFIPGGGFKKKAANE